jgi:hypothetical protein
MSLFLNALIIANGNKIIKIGITIIAIGIVKNIPITIIGAITGIKHAIKMIVDATAKINVQQSSANSKNFFIFNLLLS